MCSLQVQSYRVMIGTNCTLLTFYWYNLISSYCYSLLTWCLKIWVSFYFHYFFLSHSSLCQILSWSELATTLLLLHNSALSIFFSTFFPCYLCYWFMGRSLINSSLIDLLFSWAASSFKKIKNNNWISSNEYVLFWNFHFELVTWNLECFT